MRGIVVATLLCLAHAAIADESRHLVYVEALGKGGLYGVGYEYAMTHRLAVGGAGSFSVISDQQVLTLAPYLHASMLEGTRHSMFGEVGAILAHSHVPSPVMAWDGASNTGTGGFASLGWQYSRGHFVLRGSGSIVVGQGGVGPMIGLALGARP